MTPAETRAIVTVSLLAAFVDGEKHERERAEIKRIAEGLSQAEGVHLPSLYQDVLMKRVTLAGVLPALASEQARQLAYEMAVCVCDADGAQSAAERAFLAELSSGLRLDAAAASGFAQQAEALATAPLAGEAGAGAAAPALAPAAVPVLAPAAPPVLAPAALPAVVPAVAPAAAPAAAAAAPVAAVDHAVLDKAILDAAILNGALELLPESLSTMAIIPLQMKLVYRIGKAHGYELDAGHVKDFLATAGVGLTSQYLEQAGRKLLGGLLGSIGGGLLRGLGKQAVSSGMSFAATYALGHVAKRYYAGGRVLSTQMLREAYASMTQEAQGLQAKYLPAMQQRAQTLDAGKVMALVRGG
jgi:uncharacterized protein (DUF697 family)/tellurite resistance protein